MSKLQHVAWGPWIRAALMGFVGAAGFPQSIPMLAKAPLFDGFCRELFLLVYACWFYRELWRPVPRLWMWTRLSISTFCFYAGLFWWLDIAMEQYGGIPMPLAFLALGLVIGISTFFSMSAVFFTRCLDVFAWLPRPVMFAAGWVLQEYLRGACTQFPWGQWGYAWVRDLYGVQWASIGGIWLVSFWFACFCGYVQQAFSETGARRLQSIVWACALLLVTHAVGFLLYQRPLNDVATYNVGVVQANISQDIKNDSALHYPEIVASYQALSQSIAHQAVDLIVWPEGAWPGYLPTNLKNIEPLLLQKPLLLGAGMFEKISDENRDATQAQSAFALFNSAIYLDAQASVQGYYHKQQLVPFGEYVPFRRFLPLKKLVPSLVDFSAGQKVTLLGPEKIGVLICYDGVFPQYAQNAARAGAHLLVNLTNDGWYGESAAAYQHRDFYIFRAIETGRWIVRAANTGISVAIDPKGRMLWQTDLNTQATRIMKVGLVAEQRDTLYMRFGNWPVGCCLILWVVAFLRRCFDARARNTSF